MTDPISGMAAEGYPTSIGPVPNELLPGQTVQDGVGNSYTIEQYLGEGVTSIVYRARTSSDDIVALKMLRPDVGEKISDNFFREATILGDFAREDITAVPRLKGDQRSVGAVRFLALEFVQGRPITAILEEHGTIEEKAALQIAISVLDVLHALHDKLRRTYTDFQLQNIWVVPTADGEVRPSDVKVMDWNHVSQTLSKNPDSDAQRRHDTGVTGDLARFGAYLYLIMTGKGAYERGESTWALTQRAGNRWNAISLGTRRILLKALHPNPANRYQSALSFRDAVRGQLNLWSEHGVELLIAVEKGSEFLKSKPNGLTPMEIERLEELDCRLDMAIRRGTNEDRSEALRALLHTYIGEISAVWQQGKRYFDADQPLEAAKLWRQEVEARQQPLVWRWLILAEASQEARLTSQDKQALEATIDALERGDSSSAEEILSKPQFSAISRLRVLSNEAIAKRQIERAVASEERREWIQAASAYDEAERALGAITPNGQAILRETYGWANLSEKAQELRERARIERTGTQELRDVERSFRSNNIEVPLEALKAALTRDPNSKALMEVAFKEAEKRQQNAPNDATDILGVVQRYGDVPGLNDEVQQRIKSTREVLRKKGAAEFERNAEAAVEGGNWTALAQLLQETPPAVYTSTKDKISRKLRDEFRRSVSVDTGSEPLARTLLDTLHRLDPQAADLGLLGSQYNKLVESETTRLAAWPKAFEKDVLSVKARGDAAEIASLARSIEFAIPRFATADQKQLQTMVTELTAEAQRLREAEAEALLEKGRTALAELTRPGLDEAKQLFLEAAQRPELGIENKAQDWLSVVSAFSRNSDGVVARLDSIDKALQTFERPQTEKSLRLGGGGNNQSSEGDLAQMRRALIEAEGMLQEVEAEISTKWVDSPLREFSRIIRLRERITALMPPPPHHRLRRCHAGSSGCLVQPCYLDSSHFWQGGITHGLHCVRQLLKRILPSQSLPKQV